MSELPGQSGLALPLPYGGIVPLADFDCTSLRFDLACSINDYPASVVRQSTSAWRPNLRALLRG